MKLILRLLPIFLLISCSSDRLPQYSIIQGLRVLALTLSQPEINFDGTSFTPNTLTLTPWISDLYGAGRSLSMNVYGCLDPGIGNGAIPTCDGSASLFQVAQDQAVSNTATFLSPNYTGALTPITISLASLVAPSQSTIQAYNGSAILIFFELYLTGSPTQKITTFKRLIYSGNLKTTKNQNPSGLQILNAGTEISTLPTIGVDLNAYLPGSEAETYTSIDQNGNLITQTETLETAWFLTGPADVACSKKKDCTTDGTLALLRSVPGEPNHFTPPETALPTTRGRVLIGVAKDSRGGEVVKRYCDGICP